MSNVIKYTTTPVNDTIKKGNFALGINDVDYGPTNITGFYATTIPSTSGYTIYNQSGGTLSYQSVSGTTDLINYLSNKRGVNMTTAGEALSWAAGQSSIFVTNREYENIVTSGMVLNLDAGFVSSYPTSATTWYDLSYSGNNGTLVNGPTFSSFSGGSIVFDGVDDYGRINQLDLTTTNKMAISLWMKFTSTTVKLISELTTNSDNTTGAFQIATSAINPGDLYAHVYQGGYNMIRTNTSYNDGQYHNISLVFDLSLPVNQKIQCYVDGTSVSKTQMQSTNVTANFLKNDLYLFSRAGSSFFQAGTLNNYQLYNRALSPFEVYQNYNAMKGRFGIPDIVTSGLTLNMDAGNPYSYNPLNTGSTTWVNTTNITSGGTLTNGTFYSGGTMVFDGVDDYVIGDTPSNIDLSQPCSINTWVLFNSFNTVNPRIIECQDSSNSIQLIRDESTGKIATKNSNFQSGVNGNTWFIPTTNVWYNISVVWTPSTSTTQLYLNGLIQTGSTFNNIGIGDKPNKITLGVRSDFVSSTWLNGKIGNVQVYNRALNPIEIYQNFNALKNRYGFYDIVQEGLVLNLDAGNPNSYNPLNTGSTTWTDVSGYGSNGTLINGTFYSGGTMVFDGVDDYISVPKQTAFVNASQFTLMAWMKRRTVSSKVICHQGSDLNNDVSFELWNDGYAYFEVGNAGNTYANIANTSTNWQYMTMVFDGTQTGDSNRLKCYINGSLLNVAYNGTIPSTSGPSNSIFSIGNTQGTGGNYSDGNISVVQVYNRALSASEVQQNFNALRGRYGV
jgi:hypothetical protein